MNIASYIDHTLLKPTSQYKDLNNLCEEALQWGFAAVCIPPTFIKQARKILQGSPVKVATVIGFPLGYSTVKTKLTEIEQAIDDQADELDAVINLMALKNGDWSFLEQEMEELTWAVHKNKKLIKVIIESGVLSENEIISCCKIYSKIQVDYVKTSTGFAEKGATEATVRLLRKNLPDSVKVKASGGIHDYEFARKLIEAGADRLGCSAGVAIMKGSGLQEKKLIKE